MGTKEQRIERRQELLDDLYEAVENLRVCDEGGYEGLYWRASVVANLANQVALLSGWIDEMSPEELEV